ncbi:hypothetical protein F5J12DRAFT_783976 [Pisolithus orientalis]|uniref:uncharacterized protein n=1 Tax=Pisolithus orientalis TaxID=936130 RepID=UPI002224F834|nr:uncharacterized protein F5J12DRAFT_783976 [Pisolithus orientalis]KAI6002224.1 hypothetical protein F5J12DRAFT_783976 [Pisolithus orientalis]
MNSEASWKTALPRSPMVSRTYDSRWNIGFSQVSCGDCQLFVRSLAYPGLLGIIASCGILVLPVCSSNYWAVPDFPPNTLAHQDSGRIEYATCFREYNRRPVLA